MSHFDGVITANRVCGVVTAAVVAYLIYYGGYRSAAGLWYKPGEAFFSLWRALLRPISTLKFLGVLGTVRLVVWAAGNSFLAAMWSAAYYVLFQWTLLGFVGFVLVSMFTLSLSAGTYKGLGPWPPSRMGAADWYMYLQMLKR